MHKISLICTDATSPETVAATTSLKMDDNTIEGVRLFNLHWNENGLPEVQLEFSPGEVEISVGADTQLTVKKTQYGDGDMRVRSPQ